MPETNQECYLCGKEISESESVIYNGVCQGCAVHEKEVIIST